MLDTSVATHVAGHLDSYESTAAGPTDAQPSTVKSRPQAGAPAALSTLSGMRKTSPLRIKTDNLPKDKELAPAENPKMLLRIRQKAMVELRRKAELNSHALDDRPSFELCTSPIEYE